MSEIADRYRRLAGAFGATIAAVPDDRWPSPSPCEGWTAVEVVQHVVDSQSLFLGLIGRDPTGAPPAATDPTASWRVASSVIQAALEDPDIASTVFEGFTGETTFEDAVDGFLCFDLVVHRWDLARATGGEEQIDPEDVQRILARAAAFGDMIRSPGVCGPEVAVAEDADAQTKMLALLGRRA